MTDFLCSCESVWTGLPELRPDCCVHEKGALPRGYARRGDVIVNVLATAGYPRVSKGGGTWSTDVTAPSGVSVVS